MMDDRRSLVNAISLLGNSADGVVFLRWLLGQSGLLQAAYPTDHGMAAWADGKRFMGAAVMALVVEAGLAGTIINKED